ncbi:MAG: ABC transporter substrate-binding protein [Myxococcota bacterium]
MRALLAGLLSCLFLGGCACQKKPAGVDSGVAIAAPAPDWLAGKLPPPRADETPRKGGAFTLRVNIEPAGLTRLHDQMAEGTMARLTVGPIYETLGRVDPKAPDGPLLPLLAERWEESDDHLTLTVRLRQGVRFHDGTPLTAKDFKAVVDVIQDPKNATAAMRNYLADLSSVTTPDELTLVVKWKRPYFLANRTFLGSIFAMPARALSGDFDTLPIHRAPIGTGPFRFEKWEAGAAMTYVRNEGYWGRKAWVDRVVVRFVKDETVAAQLWERGEFDLMTRIPPTVWRAVETPSEANRWAIEGYQRSLFLENTYTWIGWNERRPFFTDARVRRALAMLYPREQVAKLVDLGLEPPTTCPYYASSESCDPSITPIPNDVDGARRLLDEAGWQDSDGDGVREKDGVPLRFTFLATTYSVKMGKLLPLFQEALRKGGVAADIERIDPGAYSSRVRARDFDVITMSWSSTDAVQDVFQIFHSSQAQEGSNSVGYANPEVDALLEQIRTEFDPKARAALERQVHRKLFDDQVYLFLSLRPQLDAVKNRVRGLAPSVAWYRLQDVWLAE